MKCDHKAEHKEVLGHVLCVCCKHCQEKIVLKETQLENVIKSAQDLIIHLEMLLGDQKLSGTYHLKERLKEALNGSKNTK
jgi:hypothetical protein